MKTYLNFLNHFRYYIYKVIKWILAVIAVAAVISIPTGMPESADNAPMIVVYAVLAIFFKLQEDANKPTVKE